MQFTNWVKHLFVIFGFGCILNCADSELKRAEKCLALGDHKVAISMFERLVQEHPDDFRVRYGYGLALYKSAVVLWHTYQDDPKQAIEHWQKVVDALEIAAKLEDSAVVKKNLSGAQHNLGLFYRKAENYGAAEYYFRHSLQNDSLRADTYNQLGYVFFARGENSKAKALFVKGLSVDSTHAQLWNNFAMVCLEQEDTLAACGALRKAIHNRPNYKAALIRLTKLNCSGSK